MWKALNDCLYMHTTHFILEEKTAKSTSKERNMKKKKKMNLHNTLTSVSSNSLTGNHFSFQYKSIIFENYVVFFSLLLASIVHLCFILNICLIWKFRKFRVKKIYWNLWKWVWGTKLAKRQNLLILFYQYNWSAFRFACVGVSCLA